MAGLGKREDAAEDAICCPIPGSHFTGFGQFMLVMLSLLLVTGCATSNSSSRPARPGSGLKEYERLVLGLQKETAAARQSLERLAAAPENKFPRAHRKFARSIERLEVTTIEARARGEAMEKRGEAYFEEWQDEITALQDEASRRAATEQLAELRLHFARILEESRQTRQEFRRFIEGLRALGKALQKTSARTTLEQAQPTASEVIAAGQSADAAMEQLLTRVQAAQLKVRSVNRQPTSSGGT